MPAPLRGTQSLVGQMGWVFARPSLTAIEIAWRWTFALPFMIVILLEAIKDSDCVAAGDHRALHD